MNSEVESFSFTSRIRGPSLLVFGAIHGDEKCGPVAIRKVMDAIQSGTLPLVRGSVTFVPVANPKAYADKSRVHKENLNRIFRKTEHPDSYEAELANELCALVDECDALLDIHSSFVPAPSNAFADYPTPDNLAFAKALAPEYLIYDWPAVYENNPFAFPAWTTERYAHEAGKLGVLVECGKHDDPEAERRAENAILRALAHFKLIEKSEGATTEPKPVYMNRIFQRDSEGDTFSKAWAHLDAVPAGTTIAERASGEKIVAERDSYIIFPKDYALPGGEWFYLGSAKWGIERE
jgi:predicted deacylase